MTRWARLSACLGAFLALCVGIHPVNAQEGGASRDWVNLLRPPAWLSDFNPIGHQLDTIEEAIPNLHIRGLLWNQTRIPLNNHSWDFDSIEFLGELELQWRPTPTLEVVNIWHQLYDAIYDWDHYWRSQREIEQEMEYYHSHKRYLRELYVRWLATPNLVITAGKHQQVWGKIDFQLIDIINPNDRRLGNIYRLSDAEYRRIPTWMVSTRYTFGEKAYVEATWNPDFEPEPDLPTRTVFTGSRFLKKLKVDKPSEAFKNHEWFLRGGFSWKGFDTMLFYGNYWSDLPVFFFKNFNPTRLPIATIEPKHTRQHSFGLAFDKNFTFFGRPMLLIYENKYDLNVYLPEFRGMGDLFSILARRTRGHRDDAWRKMNIMTQGFEIDTVWGPRQHYTFISGVFNVHVFGWDGKVPVPNARHRNLTVAFYTINIPVWWLEDRLQVGHSANFALEDGGGQALFEMAYKLSDYLSTSVRWYSNWGNQNDRPDGIFRDRDMLDFRIKYEF
ncbi:MAG: hypothetical protein HYY20_03050 [Candidatus Tectomicrobia bacterium]|uniref:DUF1302 domain-containing protein n=1 Tax=Tectimicrobiota bacterium TaxID=2528274 RepID=A0A932CMU1_UNCTE|nr:hypothetical protein [Candidatus Tectomicrobia bacterium]